MGGRTERLQRPSDGGARISRTSAHFLAVRVHGKGVRVPIHSGEPRRGEARCLRHIVGGHMTGQDADRETVGGLVMRPRWFTVKEVARMLGYGETKVRM